MKISTLAGRSGAAMWHVALAWGIVTSCCATTAAGSFLLQRQAPMVVGAPAPASPLGVPPLPPGTVPAASSGPAAHIMANIQKLHQAAGAAVAQQASLMAATVQSKQQKARDAIEKEIPLAAANDTQEIAKDVAAEQQQLQVALSNSTREAHELFRLLRDETGKNVNMSTINTVRVVEKEAEEGAMYIANHSVETEAEADALAKEAVGAANFSQEAAKNSDLWVQQLPVKDAAEAVRQAMSSQNESVSLRHAYEDVKRMAKLAGNIALATIKIAQQAQVQSEKASKESILTMEQAGQNALLLNAIREQTTKARDTAGYVVVETSAH